MVEAVDTLLHVVPHEISVELVETGNKKNNKYNDKKHNWDGNFI